MDERSRHMAKRFEVPIFLAALLVIPVIALEESSISSGLRTLVDVLNVVIWLAFLAEAGAMLWVVPDRRRWLLKHPLEVAIVLFTGPFLPASLQSVRAIRVLRVLRVLRLVPSARKVFSLDGLRIGAVGTVLLVLGGGTAFHALENNHDGLHVSLWDGVWWAVTTVTTVGYGDIYPHTTSGRLVAIVIMFAGIGFVALLTGAAAQRFLFPQVQEIVEGEQQLEADIVAADADLASELREIALRIGEIEQRIAARAPG